MLKLYNFGDLAADQAVKTVFIPRLFIKNLNAFFDIEKNIN